MIRSLAAHVRGRVVRGLFIVLPMVITVWLLTVLFDLVNQNVTPWVVAVMRRLGVPGLDLWPARFLVPLLGIVITAAGIYLIGLLAGNLLGRRVLELLEAGILRIPLVKGVYGAARQLLDAISMTGSRAFSRVVLVEYPRKGLWTLGFVTKEARHRLPGSPAGSPGAVPVFLPTTPNPTSGWMLLVHPEELLDVDMSIEEAIKLVVSGAIVGPEDLGARIRSSPAPGEAP